MIDYSEVNDRIFCDFCHYVENKYHVNLEEVILINVVKDKVDKRLKEFGYEQTISSSGSEEEAGNFEGNCQDGKA